LNASEKRVVMALMAFCLLSGGVLTYMLSNFKSMFRVTKEVTRTERMRFTPNHINQNSLYEQREPR
jgi:hypothetical protein